MAVQCEVCIAPVSRAQTNNLNCVEPTIDHAKLLKVFFALCFIHFVKFEYWTMFLCAPVLTCIVVNVVFGQFISGIHSHKRTLEA